jgi:GT2 family glycosyltransferase
MELSIIFVNWNSVKYLRECIESIREHTTGIAYEIVVVDNASPDMDAGTLKELIPGIQLIESDKNLGFASANNLGFRHSTGEYTLFLNPDTKLLSPAINAMLAHMKALPDAGIVGCKLLNTDRSVQLSSIQKFPTILNQVLDAEYLRLRWPHCPLWEIAPLFAKDVGILRVDVIPGACMLIRRSTFEAVGMFSEDYFMYAEDIDLNCKLKATGYVNYYVGDVEIVHYGGRSSSRQQVGQWATIMKYRAMVLYFRKTHGRSYEWLYRIAMGCAAAVRLMLLAIAYPFGALLRKKDAILFASKKWLAVFKWAIGFHDFAIQDQ